jgi:transposase
MAHFVGLDVSVKETSVCVVDAAGRVILEQKVPTEPADIVSLLASFGVGFCRIGIEAGPLSQWLVNALTEAKMPVICVETRHMKALLTAQQINKTDRNDARGITQMMRVGLFKPVHVKTLVAQEQRMLLTSRKLLQRKLLDLECELRGTLRNFGLKVGIVSGGRYEARVRELVTDFPRLAAIVGPLLDVRRVMRQQLAVLHKMLLDTVRDDPVCRRLCPFSGGRRACRSDAEALPIRRGRLWRRGVQMWRCPAANDALRGRTGAARPQWQMVVAEGVGRAGGSAAWATPSHRRGRQALSGGSAPNVGRW